MAILEYQQFDHGQNYGQNGQKNGQNLWSKIIKPNFRHKYL